MRKWDLVRTPRPLWNFSHVFPFFMTASLIHLSQWCSLVLIIREKKKQFLEKGHFLTRPQSQAKKELLFRISLYFETLKWQWRISINDSKLPLLITIADILPSAQQLLNYHLSSVLNASCYTWNDRTAKLWNDPFFQRTLACAQISADDR